MKKTLILLITICTLSIPAYSQVRIGVLNSQEIASKSKKGMQIQQKLENKQKAKQNKLKSIQENIERLKKEVLSPGLKIETREKKSLELQSKQTEFKRFVEDAQREIQSESQIELSAFEKELIPLINNYAKAKGFTIVYDLTSSGIVYFEKKKKKTEDIIKQIDARLQ